MSHKNYAFIEEIDIIHDPFIFRHFSSGMLISLKI